MPSYQEAKIEVERLVNHFASLSSKELKTYNEAATRQEFILPLFDALGWNTRNAREVAPEEQVSRGRVDYAFRLNGVPRFFLETKKVSENLDDPRWAKQAINYAWLKSVTWAVLSDFEETRILNAEWQETVPQRAVFKGLNWREYVDKFDDLMLLSKEAIRDGEIDRIAESVGRKIKRTPVNRQLFEDLATWRHELFRHLRPYNQLWSIEQVDEAVQRILNRLIFIRTVEDRRIEEERLMPLLRQLEAEGRKGDLVKRLSTLFRDLDAIYNERLFAPHFSESAQSEADPYITIIEGLHNVQGGYGFYDFSAIDADVLGTIYEQYLGYVAQDPEATQVVSKRGKRKSQGIYYTPQFVVRYIVQQTLGRMLEEGGLELALNIKVLDPACGSGSFLLEAFNVLDNFVAHERGELPGENPNEDATRRKHILTHNLYGVDLDGQAIEITKLNLWLRAVNSRDPLPELKNIRQGDSLIDDRKIVGNAAFNWRQQFQDVMNQGGFDVVIGNPPYFNVETLGKNSAYAESIKGSFPAIWMDKSDILFYFIAKGTQLLKSKLSFIVSRAFLEAAKAKNLREFILGHCVIESVIDFQNYRVFQEANIATAIITLRFEPDFEARHNQQIKITKILSRGGNGDELLRKNRYFMEKDEAYFDSELQVFSYPQSWLTSDSWSFASVDLRDVWRRIDDNHPKLGNICHLGEGMQTGANNVFEVSEGTIWLYRLETHALRRRARNSDVKKYIIQPGEEWLIYLEDVSSFSEYPPQIAKYLEQNRETLEARAAYQRGNCEWFKFTWPLHKEWYEHPKLIVPYRAKENSFALDADAEYVGLTDTTNVFKYPNDSHDLKYYLGLLNSKLLTFRFRGIAKMTGSGIYEYFENGIRQLPIRTISFDDPADIEYYNRMVGMVERMLALKKEYAAATVIREDRRHDIEREINELDAQINRLVYDLYGLTDEEVAFVEAS